MQAESRLHFNTIVVATDLTALVTPALQYAQAIARLHNSVLVIVHVIDPVGYAFPDGAPAFAAADQTAREELRRIESRIRSQGIRLHSVVETGVIYERILQTVIDHKADMLVLDTSSETSLGKVALGTVARQLLAKTPCPLLTVSPSAGTHLQWAGRWRHVLAAVDFSAASLAALGCAHRISGQKLIALHAPRDCDKHQCAMSLERLLFLAPFNESHTVPVEHVVAAGDAGAIIAEHAQRSNADIVVLGAPSHELTADNFFTSTVLRVISRVSVPVLCVPATRDLRAQKQQDHACLVAH